MSDLVTIAKNRKTGKWDLLAGPDQSFDEHNKLYRKITASLPVNDDYEKIVPSRIQPFLTRQTFVTSEENKMRQESLSQVANFAANSGKAADDRQATLDKQKADAAKEAHDNALDEKNALINAIRKASGQNVISETKTEQAQTSLSAQLASEDRNRPSDILRAKQKQAATETAAIAAVPKTDAEILAEKNALIESTKKQAQSNLDQQEQAAADKQARVENKKTSSAKT